MSDILRLEVIQAKKGDCLILFYGSENDPHIILIDGGPGRVYEDFLFPRLEELSQELGSPLNISLTMVSHIDDDHINGILDFIGELREAKEDDLPPLATVQNIWFNTFDDIIGNTELPDRFGGASNVASVNTIGGFEDADEELKAVVASTNQGRQLSDAVRFLGITKNEGSSFLAGPQTIQWHDDLEIIVLHPNKKRLRELQTQWDKDLTKAKNKGDDSIIFASLKSRDKSPFNLASIVCVVKYKRKTILLTGDARDDDIIEGLTEAKLMKTRGVKFDILKVPHHGSSRNMSVEFFKKVKANTYIFSGDGTHDNPDASTLDMLLEASKRRRKEFTVMFTNLEGKHSLTQTVKDFKKRIQDENRNIKVIGIDKSKLGLALDLL